MKKVLIVEDDPILKNLLGTTFANKFETLYASNGGEAVSLIESHKPGLVLLDLMLPGVGGFDVLERVRGREDELKDTPIIVVSNLSQESEKAKAKELGANDYMVKAEVSVEEIEQKVNKFLS